MDIAFASAIAGFFLMIAFAIDEIRPFKEEEIDEDRMRKNIQAKRYIR